MEKAASFLSSLLGGGGSPEPVATVKSILVYPIKSCRGISVPQAPITSTGFWWDRQWLVVNSKGRAYTQRVEPKLALVEVEMPPEAFTEEWQPTADSYMVIRAPGMDPLKIPLGAERTTVDVSVWEWSGSAYDEGDEAAEWFSTYFGNPSRLVRFKEVSEVRPTNPDYAQNYKIMFTDCFPFLLASQANRAHRGTLIPPCCCSGGSGGGVWLRRRAALWRAQAEAAAACAALRRPERRWWCGRKPGCGPERRVVRVRLRGVPSAGGGAITTTRRWWETKGAPSDGEADRSPSRRTTTRRRRQPEEHTALADREEAEEDQAPRGDQQQRPATTSNRWWQRTREGRRPAERPAAVTGSLDTLNEILKEPVPMNRFRPNILVDGCHPYSEDLWKTIKINNLTFLGVKLCNRCKVPTINQDNGIHGTEPTETMLTFRSDEVLRPSHKNKRQVYFGQNLVCKESLSAKGKGKIIKVGDPIYVLQTFPSSDEAPA